MQTEIKAPSGKMYNLAPLALEDIIDLKAYCQYLPWHTLYEHKDQFPNGYIDKQLDRIFDDCAKQTVTEADIDKHVSTLEGARELLYLSLRRNHDNLTRAEAGTILTLDNFQDIVKRLLVLSGMWEEGDKKPNPTKPTRRRSK